MTTQQSSDEPGGKVSTGLKRVVAASMAGTVVEWYEFFLYGTASTDSANGERLEARARKAR